MSRRPWSLAALALLPWCGRAGCPNLCSEHGYCDDSSGVCHCDHTYTGGDCSLRTCPDGFAWSDMASAHDVAHARAECSNAGLCNRERGNCLCAPGYEGPACERMSCPGGADAPCNGHGVCMSMRDFAGTSVSGIVPYTQPWDADKIFGCLCDKGYNGHDCMSKPCPVGDDPLTTGQVDGSQVVHCNASHGTFQLRFRGDTTVAIPADATREVVEAAINGLDSISGSGGGTGGGVAVALTGRGQTTACGVDRVVTELVEEESGAAYNATYLREHNFTVTFMQIFGPQQLIEVQETNALSDGGSVNVSFGVTGNKESELCSNRGICDVITGICTCAKNYDTSNGRGKAGTIAHNRGDCGNPTASITACPGEVKCSAHGVCQETNFIFAGALRPPSFRCSCSAGWTGSDCSVRTCPYGRAWFGYPFLPEAAHAPAECSNRGFCDGSTGMCTCDHGFTGGACERRMCPTQTESACNGHGRCLSMALLAEQHKSDDGSSLPFTYGSNANNDFTWDGEAMTGCLCDEGFHGHDCYLKSCPVGDDPLRRNTLEKQAFKCTTVPVPSLVASGTATTYGSFAISFRGVETAWIDIGATEATVKAELEKLSTIGKVEVVFLKKRDAVGAAAQTAADAACTDDGSNVVEVTFLTELGNLPAMTFRRKDSVLLGSVRVFKSRAGGITNSGTKKLVVCSSRGICNEIKGECVCFDGFGSSDGQGGPGSRGDCGHVLEWNGGGAGF